MFTNKTRAVILISKKIPLQNGMFAIVDDEDYERVKKYYWHVVIGGTKTDLRVMRNVDVNGVNVKRVLSYFILKKEYKKGDSVIYKNKDKLDNRRSNLEVISTKKSTYRTKGHRNSSSRYKGVSWHKQTKKWVARIKKDYKPIYIGIYKDEDDAGRAYNNKSLELFGEHAYQNVIGEENSADEFEVVERIAPRSNKNNKTGYRGVSEEGRYYRVDFGGEFIGIYDNAEDAAYYYNVKAKGFYGGHAILNKLPSAHLPGKIRGHNNYQAHKTKSKTTSRYKGVCYDKYQMNWMSYVYHMGKNHNNPRSKTETEAAKAYDKKAYELYGDKAILNFPESINEYKEQLNN